MGGLVPGNGLSLFHDTLKHGYFWGASDMDGTKTGGHGICVSNTWKQELFLTFFVLLPDACFQQCE